MVILPKIHSFFLQFDVGEAVEMKSHPQWDFATDDEEEKSEAGHSDVSGDYTEDEGDDD